MKKEFLYPAFAKAWPLNGNVWLYSDPHFADPEMPHIRKNYIGDDEQVKRINRKVGRNDVLIILGDVGDTSYVSKLHGYKVLIMGNHDKGATNYKRIISVIGNDTCPICGNGVVYDGRTWDTCGPDYAWCPTCGTVKPKRAEVIDNHLFDEVYTGVLMINEKIILSHQPIANLPPFMFNIHGHDHSNWFTGSRHLNVCAEHINYTPVSLTEIIKSGMLKDVESIHRLQIDATVAKKAGK